MFKNTPKWVWIAGLVLGAGALLSAMPGDRRYFRPPASPGKIRSDNLGDGHYGASRTGGRQHKGIDFQTESGQMIGSPVGGVVTRIFNAYSDSTRWKGVELRTEDNYRIKVMYVEPTVGAGDVVNPGDMIGIAQPIHEKYGAAMLDHVHVELWTPAGKNIDPTPFFQIA